jgi:hypothetical protein
VNTPPLNDVNTNNTRIVVLAALASIQRECEAALDSPEVSFTSICRIASLARQALGPAPRRPLPSMGAVVEDRSSSCSVP